MHLLTEADLPTSDLLDANAVELFVIRDANQIVGVIGLELTGDHSLLRSLAVHPMMQGHGLGQQLVDAVHQHAIGKGVDALFLLTTSAEDYFGLRGYRRLDRKEVPADIQSTQQFAKLCPASAVVMMRELGSKPSHITRD
nr:arsenic resistance N-acetyltransferase ArsN2 [Frateuria defendens]